MTVNVSKPAINVREKLAELDKPTGIAGEAMLRAETPQEQFNLIGAGRRNLIINGAMQVAQRGTSASINNTEQFVLDRFNTQNSSAITATAEQSSDAPDGFAYSYKLTFTTGAASSTNEYSISNYYFEKQEMFPTGHGTSSPKKVTLSFWVKSSVTGNHALGLQSWAPSRRSNTHSYTINSANTWEYKTVSFTMDTTAVTVANNEKAFGIRFGHAAGTTYEAATDSGGWVTADDFGFSGAAYPGETTNATWQITGVQLEVGKVATPFEHRSYGEELALCQRYYSQIYYQWEGTIGDTGNFAPYNPVLPVTMRAAGTVTHTNASNGSAVSGLNSSSIDPYGLNTVFVVLNLSGTGYGYYLADIAIDAEL